MITEAYNCFFYCFLFFFFQAEDCILDLVRSRGLGDVYKRQGSGGPGREPWQAAFQAALIPAQQDPARGQAEQHHLSLIHI